MRYILLLILLFLIIKPVYSITKEEKKLFDTLFTTSVEEDLSYSEVEDILDLVANSASEDKYKTLYKFIETSGWRSNAIGRLIKLKDTTALVYCKKFKDDFIYTEWTQIKGALRKHPWKLHEFHKIFFNVLATSKDGESRSEICYYFKNNVLHNELPMLRKHLDKETDRFARMCIYSAHAIYVDSTFNKQIIKWFNEFKEPKAIKYLIEVGIKNYNRYDLIPELKKFKKRLKNIKEVTQVNDAEDIIKAIDSVIPKLNKNKPAGKPLDWGLDY